MDKDGKHYRDISAFFYSQIRPAYDLICRRISKKELKNKEDFFLRANKEFKKAQEILLDTVIGIERSLVKDTDFKIPLINNRVRAKRLSDCLVWSIIGDRQTIKEFSRGKDPGYIHGSSGMYKELEVLKKINQSKTSFALLNDLTTCMRIGDILKTDTKPPGWKIIEVKTSGPREIMKKKEEDELSESRKKELARFERQHLRSKSKFSYLETGLGFDQEKGVHKIFIPGELDDDYHTQEIELVLSKAMEKGSFVKEVEDGLVYGCIRSDSAELGPEFLIDKLPKKYKYSTEKSMSPVSYLGVNFSGRHLMPIYLLPVDPDLLFQLVFGFCHLYVYLDVQTMINKIERKGIEVELTRKGLGDRREVFVHNNQLLKMSNGKIQTFMGQNPFGRVLGEGLKLSSMVKSYTEVFLPN